MAQLLFNIKNQWIYRTDKFKPVAKSKNYLYAQFTFLTCEWEGMTATALFENGKQVLEKLIDQDGVCEVPWEMLDLEEKGEFYVSVFAGDLITANRVRVTVYESGYTDDAESSRPPTPSIYAQIIERMDGIETEMEEATREARESAESALDAKAAAENAQASAEAALREIRALISSLTDIPIVMTDSEGNVVSVMALGRIEE